jgi:hypothetical protein
MNTNLLTDLTRIARVGANALGQSSAPATMQQVWGVLAEAEKLLAEQIEADKALPIVPEVLQSSDASAP